jgi:hypothetical protein
MVRVRPRGDEGFGGSEFTRQPWALVPGRVVQDHRLALGQLAQLWGQIPSSGQIRVTDKDRTTGTPRSSARDSSMRTKSSASSRRDTRLGSTP